MTRKGPLLTLAGGGALALVLLIASISAASQRGDQDPALAGDQASSTPSASAQATGDPAAEAAEPAPVTYVGWVDGGAATVAVIVTGDEAIAYVCDGAAVEAWLAGTARNGELVLEGADGSLVGSYDDTEAAGQTSASGRDWTFTIEAVAAPEGLYRFADTIAGGAEVDGGWIVLPDGTQVGLLTVDGHTEPAPALDPDTGQVSVAGQDVTAQRQG